MSQLRRQVFRLNTHHGSKAPLIAMAQLQKHMVDGQNVMRDGNGHISQNVRNNDGHFGPYGPGGYMDPATQTGNPPLGCMHVPPGMRTASEAVRHDPYGDQPMP